MLRSIRESLLEDCHIGMLFGGRDETIFKMIKEPETIKVELREMGLTLSEK